MPYWSSSRVGAVPQGQPTKQKKRTDRYNRKKGITMEDLKKQTAIRLAQEQKHQGREFASSAQDRGGGVVASNSYNAARGGDSSYAVQNPSANGPPPEELFQPPSNNDNRRDNGHTFHTHRYDRSHDDNGATPGKRSGKKSRNYPDHPRSAPRPSKSSTSDPSAAKSKLPHGLTVHELKEMTKARLQAEASEKRDLTSPEPLGPVPAVVGADYREHSAPSSAAASPTPQNFGRNLRSPYSEPNYAHQHDNWSHDGSRNELWENGSVSTQTSDYIGSEQAFGLASYEDNAYNLSRSLSANSGYGHEFPSRDAASPAMGQAQSYFDSSPGSFPPNRRRAATLSPRAGLSHLHEDRPVFPGQELPGLPSFSSTSRPKYIAPRHGAFLSPEANRGRTLSAVSLPAMSRTAEEFAPPVTGLSDVFRTPPPGFSDDVPRARAATDDLNGLPSEPRTRASTWGETTASDLFGSSDLASILKLSGAQEKE